ncbi:MAG TPA: hypothetical protein VKV40_13430 [Ktedonobacteraceae bacterium]|nr:hypothetical protein [Ktedonobacteraceae bacterium]
MDIIVAYFHPLHHPESVKRDFDQIRAVGASSIVYAIHEQEAHRWPRDLERGLQQAQDAGLKVYLSLGRYGNVFSGPIPMPSWYTFHNPRSRVMDSNGRYHDISCYNHEPFRSWLFKEIEHYLRAFPINGIFVDEPRGTDITCFCSVCRALCPDVVDLPGFRRRSMIDFLGALCSRVKQADAHAKTTVAIVPENLDQLDALVTLSDLDTVACHLFWKVFKKDVSMVSEWSHSVVEATRHSGKRSQLWLQNFDLDEENEEQLGNAFTQALHAEPDDIGCYYYWRNNADPGRVWQRTRTLLRHVPRRQLYWR